jgi:hypothetical protein
MKILPKLLRRPLVLNFYKGLLVRKETEHLFLLFGQEFKKICASVIVVSYPRLYNCPMRYTVGIYGQFSDVSSFFYNSFIDIF